MPDSATTRDLAAQLRRMADVVEALAPPLPQVANDDRRLPLAAWYADYVRRYIELLHLM